MQCVVLWNINTIAFEIVKYSANCVKNLYLWHGLKVCMQSIFFLWSRATKCFIGILQFVLNLKAQNI